MATSTTMKSVLVKFGMKKTNGTADTPTINWVTQVVGLSSPSDFLSLTKSNLDTIAKRLSKDASSNSANMPAGCVPQDHLRVTRTIELVSIAVKWYASRGVAVGPALLTTINHDKAAKFFQLVSMHRQKDVDKDSHPELPVLGKSVAINSAKFMEWKERVIDVLSDTTSVDGVGTLGGNLRSRVAPSNWNDVDMTDTLAEISDAVSPLGGEVFQVDEKRIYSALVEALNQVGSSYTDKYKRTKSARAVYEDICEAYYPEEQKTEQVENIERVIDASFYKGPHTGYTFVSVADTHRKAHTKLDELGAGWDESKKVKHFIQNIRVQDSQLDFAINTVKADRGVDGKYNDFEKCVAFLTPFVPAPKKPGASIKSVTTSDGREYLDEWDDEGRTLTEEQRKEQCKGMPTPEWKNVPLPKKKRIYADRDYWDLWPTNSRRGKGKGKGGGGGGTSQGGGADGKLSKSQKRNARRKARRLAQKKEEEEKAAEEEMDRKICAVVARNEKRRKEKRARKKAGIYDSDDSSSSDDSDFQSNPSNRIKKGRKKSRRDE